MSSMDQKTDIEHCEINVADAPTSHGHSAVDTHGKMPFNPAPIGFGAFALSSFVLGLYNSGLITDLPQVAVGVAFGYGAMGQFVCGICEIIAGNVFAATTMLTFSGFFLTFGIMMVPSSGVLELMLSQGGMESVHKCMGLVQIGYAIAAFLFLLGTLRQPVLIRLVLLQVFLAFLMGGVGGLTGITNFNIASGWISFTLALTAWYLMCAMLYTPATTFIKLPIF